MNNGRGRPVVALDIDGTLGDYHGHFLNFAEGYFGEKFPSSQMENPGLPLWQFMKIPHELYKECKLAYRQGGLKRSMPAFGGVSDLTHLIREEGAEVWICTTRPYLRLDNIDPDTREWLRRNNIWYDAVLFDPLHGEKGSKYQELFRQAGLRVCYVLEDLPEYLAMARQHFPVNSGVFMGLKDQPYNRHIRCFDNPWRAARRLTITECWPSIRMAIQGWKAANS